LKKVNINFLNGSVIYFRDFRIENLKVFNNFYRRLGSLFNDSKRNHKKVSKSYKFFNKIVFIFFILAKQILRFPKYVIQTWKLNRYHCKQIKSCEAFCIASSRLDLDGTESVVTQLERLTEAIGGGTAINLFPNGRSSNNTVILFDPQIESGFWSRNQRFSNEKIFIFDGAFIIFFSVYVLITGIFLRSSSELLFIWRYLKQTKSAKVIKRRSFYLRIVEALIFVTYHSLIDRLPKHSTTFLTSNSFLVELLRIYLLQDDKSQKITELLHGIIADPTEKFFKRILTSKENKHRLIPQVPDLPELEHLTKEFFVGNNASINTYLNSSLYENKKIYNSYKDYALENFKKLRINPDDKILTITIYGGTSIEGNFFESSGYEIEIEILDMIVKYFKDKKIKTKLIYVPHPANKILPRFSIEKFYNFDVQILEHSIFTYFITDYCISNISSCLFELSWLGAECFSPIIEQDELFSSKYLDTIHHPETNGLEALEKSLRGCLDAGLKENLKSYTSKFNARLVMVKGNSI